uniref:Uncharacterized protein n=1 Tax=Vespula pensylvanica TaxID=30213 RepID=A0A834P9U1_VESPE|nr:hypothetical protein H0235_002565 [Vespula pensylvanica]
MFPHPPPIPSPTTHLAFARRSNGFTDSRYPQYSIFISESNFTGRNVARRVAGGGGGGGDGSGGPNCVLGGEVEEKGEVFTPTP